MLDNGREKWCSARWATWTTSECGLANLRQAKGGVGWGNNTGTVSIDCCSNGRPSFSDPVPPNGCNHTGGAASVYLDEGYTYSASSSPSWAGLQTELRAQRPVAFNITWNNCNAAQQDCGHYMVAIGEHMDDAGGEWIVVNDPGGGDTVVYSYAAWANTDPTQYGYVFNGQLTNVQH